MPLMQIELKQRVVSAVILGLIVLGLAWYGGVPFKIFAAILAFLIYVEWTMMIRAPHYSAPGYVAGWAAIILVMVFTITGAGVAAVASLLIGSGTVWILARATGRKAIWIALGVLYAGFSGLAIAEVRDDTTLGLIGIAFIFAVVWATDIFAYFCGRALGGKKLAPKISPGKTWSGAVFGVLAAVAAGTAVALVTVETGSLWIPVLAGILSVSSQLGDLFESWMKRKHAVKDSGRLIPGHGGVMDRVDGLVFAAFAAFVIAVVAEGGIPTREFGSPIAASMFGL
jgi:phosphatidate cytidylyltransferase